MTHTATVLVLGCLTAALIVACDKTTEGAASEAASITSESTPASTTSETTTETTSPTEFKLPAYGVVPTTKRPLAPGEITCELETELPNTVSVTGAAAGSPTVIVALPEGFSSSPGQGDVASKLTGPDGMTGSVTIAPTTLGAEAAFEQYANQRTEKATINSVSLLPGELCDYSGQELIGILADNPGEGVDYADRIVHVWTDSGDFLVAVALEAPNSAPGFDAARTALLADFGIRMPG